MAVTVLQLPYSLITGQSSYIDCVRWANYISKYRPTPVSNFLYHAVVVLCPIKKSMKVAWLGMGRQWSSVGYRRPRRTTLLPPPKVVRCLMSPLSTPFVRYHLSFCRHPVIPLFRRYHHYFFTVITPFFNFVAQLLVTATRGGPPLRPPPSIATPLLTRILQK